MGTSTTERGVLTIPGAAEVDWLFTAGLTSIAPVCWSQYTLPKNKETQFTNCFINTHLYSFQNEMK
jgi:hypothetical protein